MHTSTPATDYLTPRQRAFVDAYLDTDNATAAARSAGYATRSAARAGNRLVHSDRVQAAIREQQRAEGVGARLDQSRIIAMLMSEAQDRNNTGAVRVSAQKALADIAGLSGGRGKAQHDNLTAFLAGISKAIGEGVFVATGGSQTALPETVLASSRVMD
jgi:hypothetical protein